MQNFALVGATLLAMVIPVAAIYVLGLTLRGVTSLDLSVSDWYIVTGTPLMFAVLAVFEAVAVLAASYLFAHAQAGRVAVGWLQ
jgi:uncharacterized membrane protein YfbV (UPF0208 family)